MSNKPVRASNTRVSYRPGNAPVVLIPENPGRIRFAITNKSGTNLLINYGDKISGDNYAEEVGANETLRVSFPADRMYVGPVVGIFENATSGEAIISEWHK